MTDAELHALLAPCPAPGTRWRHYKGAVCRVVFSGLLEANCEPAVAYCEEGGGVVWIRPLYGKDGWFEMVPAPGHAPVPRFTPVPSTGGMSRYAGKLVVLDLEEPTP